MKLQPGDELTGHEPSGGKRQQILAITTGGYGKRTDPDQYREQGRNGMGIRAMALPTGPGTGRPAGRL